VIGEDGTIYVRFADDWLCALNMDGSAKWEYEIGASTPPAISLEGTIIIGSSNPSSLLAVSPDGQIQWRCQLQSRPNLIAPAINNEGTVYIVTGHSINAVSSDGNLKWEFVADDRIESSPAIHEDGSIYFACRNGLLYCIDNSGELKWFFPLGFGGTNTSPAIGPRGWIYIGSDLGHLYAIHPDAGYLVWMYTTEGPIRTSPIVDADTLIYVGSEKHDGESILYAINPNGTVAWRFRKDDYFGASDPAIGPDGILYISYGLERMLYAVRSGSSGLCTSPWPKIHANYRNTGNR